jgi:hypothetical protein
MERLNCMAKRHILALCILALLLPSCAFLPAFTQEEYSRRRHEEMDQQYTPYRQRNTIEGYREFIARYPRNMYLETALDQIDNLEFAPYEKADTIASYSEFVARYPGNRHAVAARGRIDQANIKNCENIDTIEAYRQFLEQHPDNIFAQTAQDRLQDLEFRALAEKMQQQGFDLLLYRLHVKRLQKDLPTISGISLGDFTLFASMETVQGRQYFKSHLIYSSDLNSFARAPVAQQEQIFDALVAKLITSLASEFRTTQGIDGFSFALARSRHRYYGNEKTALEYTFPAREALLFGQNRCDRSRLLSQATVRQTLTTDEATLAGAGGRFAVKLEGGDIMEKSAGRQRANDFIMSATWKRVSKDGTVHEMKTVRKWKDFKGAGGYSAKSVVNYSLYPARVYADAILTAADTTGNLQNWYMLSKGDAGRTPNIDSYRPPAEWDFPLAEFAETPVGLEHHQYAGSAPCGSGQCLMVYSMPAPGNVPYGKKTSFIDQQSLLPLKIEYFDKGGELWKTAHLDWQETGGIWFWRRAVIENVPSGAVTTIVITDVKANTGLAYIDFTPGVMQRR